MTDAAGLLIEHCREAGQRITGQRRVIADVVAKADDHPDIPEIYRRGAGPAPCPPLSIVSPRAKVSPAPCPR